MSEVMDYRYSEIGLDNVILRNLPVSEAEDEDGVWIPRVNVLHRLLVEAVALKRGGLEPKELRFLRTVSGYKQTELAALVGRDLQTIGRWERGESPIDRPAELIVRARALEVAGVRLETPIDQLALLAAEETVPTDIIVDASDPQNYRLLTPPREEAPRSGTVTPFRPKKPAPTQQPQPEPLRLAARTKSKSAEAAGEEPPTPAEKKQMELIGRIVSGEEEATLRRREREVFIDLPPGRKVAQLRLGNEDYSLVTADRTRRYLVKDLSPGDARRFVLNQAENPAKHQAWWT